MRRIVLILLLCATLPAWGQGASVVIAAGGVETRLDAARLDRVTQAQQPGPGGGLYSGASLWSVLVDAGATQSLTPSETIRAVVRVTGRDNYAAVFTLAELDPDYGARPVLLAWRLNGAALPGDALRVIAPGERRAGRSVRDVARIAVE